MVKKLLGIAAVVLSLAAAAPAPAPAIDYICSCTVCTSPTQGLGCRDPRNGYRFTSCGTYYSKYCAG
ncbi:MAG TPA: hypothetical protein VIW92_02480 [Thermoanaerobaculia bacterium]